MTAASSTAGGDWQARLFRSQVAWLMLAAAIVVLFYWQLLFTDRFSFLLDRDDANQAYSWSRFAAFNIQRGILPLWDPNIQGGHSFIGEMQTGLFYPLKLPFCLWPLDRSGWPSMPFEHAWFVVTHTLGAWFMFFLAREIGLRRFASLVAALCFSLGGFMGGPVGIGWPHQVDSGIWLPLILLFLTRSLCHPDRLSAILAACLAGLGLAMVVLAGGLHVAIMDVLAVLGFTVVFVCWQPRVRLSRALTTVLIAGVVSFGASAIQLLPAVAESGAGVERYINDWLWLPANQKIPYDQIVFNLPPSAVAALVFGNAPIGLAEYSPYFGLLPLLLVVLGAWRYWNRLWPRYLAIMAALAFFYTFGSDSPLHRFLYAVVPYLWLAKEPARFLYLTHAAMALLAGFGIEALFSHAPSANRLHRLRPIPQVLLVLLMIFDWHYFNRSIQDKIEARQKGQDYLEYLQGCQNLAAFFQSLQSQQGLFRVNVDDPSEPNLGDLFGVQTVSGPGATRLIDFKRVWQVPMAADLLNVRFFVCRSKACPAGITPVYQDAGRDAGWTAFENTGVYPRARLVHDVTRESSQDAVIQRMKGPGFDARKTAVLAEALEDAPEPLRPGIAESAQIATYQPNRLSLRVHASSRSLLVLSENYSPGWHAKVNGADTPVHKVDVTIRGIMVPAGDSRVELRYLPRSVIAGAILSGVTWAAVLILAWFARASHRPRSSALAPGLNSNSRYY